MPSPIFWSNLLWALGAGASIAALLWLLRAYAPVSRIRLTLFLSVVFGGLYWVLQSAGISTATRPMQAALALGILLGANALLQLVDWFLWDYLLGQRRHVAVPRLLVDVFNFIVLGAVMLAILDGVFGVELTALLVTSTIISAVIGLALQDLLTSIVAGLALQVERPFRVGDWVQLEEHAGQIVQLNWRTLTLRTRDNHHIILPNANVAKHTIVNYSAPTPLQRQHLRLGLAYSHPPGEVRRVLLRVLTEVPGIAMEPAPQVVVAAYGDFAIQYDLRYWINDYAQAESIHDEVQTRLWYELRRAGLTIPFPMRDITMRTLPEDHLARQQEQQRRDIFGELRQVPLFAPLSHAQIEQLVHGAVLQRYTAGEALVRQGDPGDSLFVIKTGRVRVEAKTEAGLTPLGTLGPDDFFGEMSLLTGEPRSASVIALTETEVVVVDKADLAQVVQVDTPVLEAISLKLTTRTRVLTGPHAGDSGPLSKKNSPQQTALLQRIRGFFGVKS